MEICTRCILCKENDDILAEIAHSNDRSLRGLFSQIRNNAKGALREKVVDLAKQRLSEDQIGDEISTQEKCDVEMSDKILPKDFKKSLDDFIVKGDLIIDNDQVIITPKGTRKLANRIKIKVEKSIRKEKGNHDIKNKIGFGLDYLHSSAIYKIGDSYNSIDIQKTVVRSIIRNAHEKNLCNRKIKKEDIYVFEKTYEDKMCICLVIDQSASMDDKKRNAAVDTALSLAMFKKPGDKLKVFLFSSQIKEVPLWDIPNSSITTGGTTDIKTALQVVRTSLYKEKGKKHVYLITDTEPNTENNKYVGFAAAATGVSKEAARYRHDNITLNIIMLDTKVNQKKLASRMAKVNLGRVIYANPGNLGKAVVEDYLSAKAA